MRRVIIDLLLVLVALAVTTAIVRQRPVAAEISPNEQVMVDGTLRKFRQVVPHSLLDPAPVVFALHGIGDSPESMAGYSQLDRLAADNGFLLVYPAAHSAMWTSMQFDPDNLDANPDVIFFDRLLMNIAQRFSIDRDRIYVVGMSNGATFAQLLVAARSSEIAAVVAHSGSKPRGLLQPDIHRPLLLIVGDEDNESAAIQADAAQYLADGHDVQLITVPGLAHEWSVRHNSLLWEFLSEH
ncbi:MAG: PHB depolymerase family esterase [Planctomycetaceae bacterium]